jgi:hypothetical protein
VKAVGRTENLAGLAILVTLAVVAAGVFLMQFRFDPSLFVPPQPVGKMLERAGAAAPAPNLLPSVPAGMTVLGSPESYDSETLSDKIDGKAELYLASGFVRLDCQRFGREGDPSRWLEVFVYDMGEPLNAYSVYSTQRRKDASRSDVARFAYTAGNALFFIHGTRYVEIVSAVSDDPGSLVAIAKSFIGAGAAAAELPAELALFPSEGLDEASISLHMSDVFGFDGLDRVYTAKYQSGDEQMTAFLSDRKTPEDAAALAQAYAGFLLQNGGIDRGAASGVSGARLIEIVDTYEIIFSCRSFLGGVHEAESREAAEKLGALLFGRLSEEKGGK